MVYTLITAWYIPDLHYGVYLNYCMVYTLITVWYIPKLPYGYIPKLPYGYIPKLPYHAHIGILFFLLFLALAHCFNLLIISELFFLYSFLFGSNVLTYLH